MDHSLISISSVNARKGVVLKGYLLNVIGLNILAEIMIYSIVVYFCVVLQVILVYIVTNLDLSRERINPTKNANISVLINTFINGA